MTERSTEEWVGVIIGIVLLCMIIPPIAPFVAILVVIKVLCAIGESGTSTEEDKQEDIIPDEEWLDDEEYKELNEGDE